MSKLRTDTKYLTISNLELAINSYLEALEISTRQDFPVDWAQTKNNLASAYSDRIRGDRTENLYLHQIPFAALPTPSGSLSDRFRLRQLPSTQILDFCQTRPPIDTPTYGTVEDATDDLPATRYEGDQIAQLYNIPPDRRLRGRQQATIANYKTLLSQVTHLLSSHHAYSRLDNSLESRLQLADGHISLSDLLLPGYRLPLLSDVFLSCCETGLSFSQSLTDDPITLATGFLCAGARNVVSTLWAVDDIATALFSIRYHHHRETLDRQTLDRPTALQRAQQDLRTLPSSDPSLKDLRHHLETQYKTYGQQAHTLRQTLKTTHDTTLQPEIDRLTSLATAARDRRDQLDTLSQQQHPFAHPIYWAGFICQGIA